MNSNDILKEIEDKLNELSHKNYDKNSFKAGYLLARFKKEMTPELQKELIEFLELLQTKFLKPKAQELIKKIEDESK